MISPLLPWEVLERIIGHSGDYPGTLHNFSLTCRDLRPRALCLLVSDVRFKRRVHIFDFCDFLKTQSHLKPLVRSITVHLDEFAPVPILNILPNLSELRFTTKKHWTNLVLNQSSLMCLKLGTLRIRVLDLSDLSFPTYLDFARLLLAFTNLTDLSCSKLRINAECNPTALEVLKRRLSRQLRLRTISVDYIRRDKNSSTPDTSVIAFLLDSEPGLVQSTFETLTIKCFFTDMYTFSHSFDWPRLRTLVLRMNLEPKGLTKEENAHAQSTLCSFLKILSGTSKVLDVVVKFHISYLNRLFRFLALETSPEQAGKLEEALLRFPRPQIVFHVLCSIREGTKSLWTWELAKCFPILFQRGALTLTSDTVSFSRQGHDDTVTDIATSPDSKWVATASVQDCTVILWNAGNGSMVHQCVAHSYREIASLAFSPDSRFLASGGQDKKTKVWDPAGASLQVVTTLEGHTTGVNSCAWSPRGNIIASGSDDGTVRLWDTHRAFHELHVLEHQDQGDTVLIAFSADGRWLISGSLHKHHVWEVATGTLHNTVSVDHQLFRVPAAVFDRLDLQITAPTQHQESWPDLRVLRSQSPPLFWSPRAAQASAASAPSAPCGIPDEHTHEVALVDVETGKQLAVLKGLPKTRTHVAFSPDGTMVLTSVNSDNGMMKLWDGYSGAELFSLEGHKKDVTQACFSPCGKYVASASCDGTVLLWRTGDGSLMATFSEHKYSGVSHVAFTPDGETLWSGDWDGLVIMRRMHNIVEIEE